MKKRLWKHWWVELRPRLERKTLPSPWHERKRVRVNWPRDVQLSFCIFIGTCTFRSAESGAHCGLCSQVSYLHSGCNWGTRTANRHRMQSAVYSEVAPSELQLAYWPQQFRWVENSAVKRARKLRILLCRSGIWRCLRFVKIQRVENIRSGHLSKPRGPVEVRSRWVPTAMTTLQRQWRVQPPEENFGFHEVILE